MISNSQPAIFRMKATGNLYALFAVACLRIIDTYMVDVHLVYPCTGPSSCHITVGQKVKWGCQSKILVHITYNSQQVFQTGNYELSVEYCVK